jgi:hypothetical protein
VVVVVDGGDVPTGVEVVLADAVVEVVVDAVVAGP